MSVQTQIQRLETAKASLRTALEEKGVTVPDTATLDGYGALVAQIPAGSDEWTVLYRAELPTSPPAANEASTRVVPTGSYAYLSVDVPQDKDGLEVAFTYGGTTRIALARTQSGDVLGGLAASAFAIYAQSGQHLVVKINVGEVNYLSYRFTTSPR
ncbi:hypothetical protein [Subdoligranulum variabile]|uniref:Uncharacterized protein n=1 Tax=Subdoligranulum variabile DSM 15176 TaxID=411471 RepID=D1PR99_9FIRM|nr:hypothetical protein [Subdoligranulum variabile]EFB74801.1 hypothetical protein SUBVAR_06928 [Subdoligranulum variabile DSM 15176]UWP66975.1 hypothetical protein NQ490_08435 [Subdoligranulum variabile]